MRGRESGGARGMVAAGRAPGPGRRTRWPSWMSLSMPRGPSVVRTASATAWHALMFEISCALPCDSSVPSRSRMICGCVGELGVFS